MVDIKEFESGQCPDCGSSLIIKENFKIVNDLANNYATNWKCSKCRREYIEIIQKRNWAGWGNG